MPRVTLFTWMAPELSRRRVVAGVALGLIGALALSAGTGCGSSAKSSSPGCTATSCPAGNACVAGACTPTCTRHSDCLEAKGYSCVAIGAGAADAGVSAPAVDGAVSTAPAGADAAGTTPAAADVVAIDAAAADAAGMDAAAADAAAIDAAAAAAAATGVATVLPPVQVCRLGAVAKLPKQYGAACGLDLDADCDTASGFTCQGQQDNVDSYCTKLGGCTADTDCPASMYCGSVVVRGCLSTDNCTTSSLCASGHPGAVCADDGSGKKFCTVTTSCHTQPDDCDIGYSCRALPGAGTRFKLARACVPRGDCDPCSGDADCGSAGSGCMLDSNGQGFCSRSCELGGTSCDPSSECRATARGNYCFPRAGSCHGDASPCSNCRDDSDCGPTGVCEVIEETRERFCIEPCSATGTCPNAPGGAAMACCTSANATDCGAFTNYCLPVPAQNPYPRSSFGCWLTPCVVNGDCPTGQLCDVRDQTQVSDTQQDDKCAASGVCRPPHDPTDAVDFQITNKVCDCAGKRFASEAALAADPASSFKGCCQTVMSTGGATYTCS